MTGPLRLRPVDEGWIADEMERELEAMTMTGAIGPTDGFVDRVMRGVAREPLPQPVRAFRVALLGGRIRAAAMAVGDAWRNVSAPGAPFSVRAQALALVLVVLLGSLTIAGGAAVGAFGLLDRPTPPPSPVQTSPLPTSPSPSPSQVPSSRPTATPAPTAEPSPTPSPSETASPDPSETPKHTTTPRSPSPKATSTDDHGGDSGSDSGGDSGSAPNSTPTSTSGSDGSDDGEHTTSPTSTEGPPGGE